MSEEKPWEKQPGETQLEFSQFRYYRDMPQPRRVLGVLHGSTADKWEMASRCEWVSRVEQYDDHISNVAIAERERVVKEQAASITEDHFRLLQGVREIAIRETAKWLADVRSQDGTSLFKISDLVKVVDCAVKLDRLTLGETTENVGGGHQDLSALSPEELILAHELAKKVGGQNE
jgi:hypothetical protein